MIMIILDGLFHLLLTCSCTVLVLILSEFDVTFENLTYAILTPKGGYDNIFIFLGGIGNAPKDYRK